MPGARPAAVTNYHGEVLQPSDVLAFWFGAHPLPVRVGAAIRRQWFRKSAAFDRRLRARFGLTLVEALAGRLAHWARSPEGWLALIVVLDQFTRNAFRAQAASFSGDVQALGLALDGLAQRRDLALPPVARLFCYLPLEHAERLDLQERAVTLIEALEAEPVDAASRAFFATNADYARRHRDLIRQYGRFPHRNAILGRTSTAEEAAYLARPGAGF